jgi:hypothetical protein
MLDPAMASVLTLWSGRKIDMQENINRYKVERILDFTLNHTQWNARAMLSDSRENDTTDHAKWSEDSVVADDTACGSR